MSMSAPVTSALHEKLSARSPNPRGRDIAARVAADLAAAEHRAAVATADKVEAARSHNAVSYTHLTLPTICSV